MIEMQLRKRTGDGARVHRKEGVAELGIVKADNGAPRVPGSS